MGPPSQMLRYYNETDLMSLLHVLPPQLQYKCGGLRPHLQREADRLRLACPLLADSINVAGQEASKAQA